MRRGARGGVEPVGCCGVSSAGVGSAGFGVLECVSIGGGCRRHVGCDGVGVMTAAFGLAAAAVRCASRSGRRPVGAGRRRAPREPVRDLASWCPLRRRRPWLSGSGGGEGAALGGRGDVGSVGGEDGFEHVAGLGDVVAVGDDAQDVVVAAAGRGDVEASAGGGR